MPKVGKITSLQYLTKDKLVYLDFRYVHRTPSHGHNLLHVSITETITNDYFSAKIRKDTWRPVMMFSCFLGLNNS